MRGTQKAVAGLLQKLVAGLPDPVRTPAELAHLANPATPEARALLRFLPAVEAFPVEAGLEPLLPKLRGAIETMALNCDRDDEQAVRDRERVRAFVTALREAVA